VAAVIVYVVAGFYSKKIENRIEEYNRKLLSLKDEIIKSEQAFFDTLPARAREAIKNKILRDYKDNILQMKKDSRGCSEKCQLTNESLQKDIDRHLPLV
jgi:GMP synthase PP-ATPase subunit